MTLCLGFLVVEDVLSSVVDVGAAEEEVLCFLVVCCVVVDGSFVVVLCFLVVYSVVV
jgi:hypothetical protein